jgi:hypothetical protein
MSVAIAAAPDFPDPAPRAAITEKFTRNIAILVMIGLRITEIAGFIVAPPGPKHKPLRNFFHFRDGGVPLERPESD